MSKNTVLTESQQKFYDFLVNFIREKGRCPVSSEIKTALGYTSNSTAFKYINILASKGKIIKGSRNCIIESLPLESDIKFILTEKQKSILDFVTSFIKKNGFSPTLKTIVKNFSKNSCAGAFEHLVALEKKGLIIKGGRYTAVKKILF